MIDLEHEALISLAEAARLRPSSRRGRPTHVSTIARWICHGVRGHRLEAVRLGSSWYTSVAALQRFAEQLAADPGQPPIEHKSCLTAQSVTSKLDRLGL